MRISASSGTRAPALYLFLIVHQDLPGKDQSLSPLPGFDKVAVSQKPVQPDFSDSLILQWNRLNEKGTKNTLSALSL